MEDAGGLNSRGFAINSFNVVAGDAAFLGPVFDYSRCDLTGRVCEGPRSFERPVYSRANGINAIGQVVGFSGQKRDTGDRRRSCGPVQAA